MAAITFVDSDRVWCKSALGLPSREVGREASFSDRTIEAASPLIVPDALADPEFASHPMVRERGGIRFYAGVPLEDADGYRVGAVCVMDAVPGDAGPPEIAILSGVATRLVAALAAYRDSISGTISLAERPQVPSWIGVRTVAAANGDDDPEPGLIVLSVAWNSPAGRAGLRPSDILLSIDGAVLRQPGDATVALLGRPPGSPAVLHVLRCGRVLTCTVAVEAAPPGRRAL